MEDYCPNFCELQRDCCAIIATKVKNRAAEDYKHISKDVSKMIIRDHG